MNFELTQYLYNSADFSVQLQTMEHSRPPVRVILAWKNRDEKIEASREEEREHNSRLGWGESIWFEIVWRGRTGESFYFVSCSLKIK